MDSYYSKIKLNVNQSVYLKDPETSELGKRIISGGIELIASAGFESFTFKKLAASIGSTEASVYRYFESKHKLLLYLTLWYWAWLGYKISFALANVSSAKLRLKKAITVLTEEVKVDGDFEHINEVLLKKILISESAKAYLNQEVDADNKAGVFVVIMDLVEEVSKLVLELNPSYKYPHMLISTVIEGANYQRYFAEHLTKLTDVVKGEDSVTQFYTDMVMNAVSQTCNKED